MKKILLSILVAAGLMISASAYALDLHGARDAGILGEKNDGYVSVLKKSPAAEALAEEVNQKRRAEYARISQQNSQPVDIVAKLAAEQIVRNLKSGNRYQGADGSWQTR